MINLRKHVGNTNGSEQDVVTRRRIQVEGQTIIDFHQLRGRRIKVSIIPHFTHSHRLFLKVKEVVNLVLMSVALVSGYKEGSH